jgi:virginiamycin B lyase
MGAPGSITAGPDGNLWFTETATAVLGGGPGINGVGRLTTSGRVTEFSAGISGAPRSIARGPDGNLWFVEESNSESPAGIIGRITPAGSVTEFNIGAYQLDSITAGPDGNLWFAGSGVVGRITPSGSATEFPTGTDTQTTWQRGIATGADGNLWVADGFGIARVTPAGVATVFPTPGRHPDSVTSGPDGNVWFTYDPSTAPGSHSGIGRITPSGTISTFDDAGTVRARDVTAGPEGSLWVTQVGSSNSTGAEIARVTPTGTVTEYPTPTNKGFGDDIQDITLGPDGALWMNDREGQFFDRFVPGAAVGPTVRCVVPKLRGARLKQARNRLQAAHCRLGKVKYQRAGRQKRGRVIHQAPSAGRVLPANSKVSVTVRK